MRSLLGLYLGLFALPVWAGVSTNMMMRQKIFIYNSGYSDLYACFNDHTCSPLADMIPIHAGEHKRMYADIVIERPIKTYYLNCTNNQVYAEYQLVFDAGSHEIRLVRSGHIVDTIAYEPLEEIDPYLIIDDTIDVRFYRNLEPDEEQHHGCRRMRIF